MATRLQDIAERVGVSTSTVSLVLNGRDKGRVNATSAERIRLAADDMGYLPNMLARGLKTRHSKTIGILAEGVASIPFSGAMLAGAQDIAWKEGYLLLVVDVGHHEEMHGSAMRMLLQRDIDALVLAADYPRRVIAPDLPGHVPVVLLDAQLDDQGQDSSDVDWIMPDDEEGAYQAVCLLIAAGHRKIDFLNVSHPDYVSSEMARSRGYLRALEAHGIVPDLGRIQFADGPETSDGRVAMEQILACPDRPTAMFCFSDRLAMGVYQVARRRGINIPDQLSIIGYDDQPGIADAMDPGLTTVELPHRRMGELAARLTISRIRDREAPLERRYVTPRLIERASVAPPATVMV